MAEQSIGEMMAEYAEAAVLEAAQKNIALAYDEPSLRGVDEILDLIQARLLAEPAELDEACKRWGGYFGEVVRRRWGGEWTIDTYPGKSFLVVTLSLGGSKIYPAMKVHRRLTEVTGEEGIWQFYQMLQARLGAAPATRIQ